MAKIVLDKNSTNLDPLVFNENFRKIEEEFNEKVLYRENPPQEPNEMENDLDMNGNRIYNLPKPIAEHEPARLIDLTDGIPVRQFLRVEDASIEPIGDIKDRKNKLLYFDSEGNPKTKFPSDDSATQLRVDLEDPDGAALVGFKQAGAEATNVQTALRSLMFNSVSEMKSTTNLKVGMKVRTLGYYSAGDGGGCDYEIVAAGTGSNFGFLYEQLTGSGLEAKLLGGGIMEDKTVFIPTQYPTLQAAVDDLYGKVTAKRGVEISLVIESGHELTHGLHTGPGDYSHLVIKSQDSLVDISPSFVPVYSATNVPGSSEPRCFVYDIGTGPVVDCVISGRNFRELASSGIYGYTFLGGIMISQGGKGIINYGAGFIEFTGAGLYVRSRAEVSARGTTFRDNGASGAQITGNSSAEISDSNFSGAWWNVPNPSDALTDAAVSVSRGSFVSAQNVNADNSRRTGLDARRSTVHFGGSTARNCGRAGLCARNGSTIYAAAGIDLGADGWIELRKDGGGTIYLASGSIYNNIRSGGAIVQANTITDSGIVFDSDRPLGTVTFQKIETGEGVAYVYSDGTAKQYLVIVIDTTITTAQSFNLPVALMSGTPKVVNISCGSISGTNGRDAFSKLVAGMLTSSTSSFMVRMTETHPLGPLTIQVEVSGRVF